MLSRGTSTREASLHSQAYEANRCTYIHVHIIVRVYDDPKILIVQVMSSVSSAHLDVVDQAMKMFTATGTQFVVAT